MATTLKPRRAPTEIKAVLDLIKQKNIQVVDVKFTDLPGTWQHFSIPAATLDEDMVREGLGFDGSSIRGFQAINESDMLLMPDLSTAFVDPVLSVPTLSITCDIYDPITLEPYSRDPRFIAFKAEEYLKTTGIATTSYWGPEAEFFIFNSVRFDQNAHEGYYYVDAEEGVWNSGRNGTPNLGHRPRHKEGYFPVPPVDRLQDVRSKIMLALVDAGIPVEVQHHEVATAGQAEIDFRFGSLLLTADRWPTSTSSRTSVTIWATRPRSCPSRCSVTTAPACTSTSPSGRATTRCSTTRRGTPSCPTRRGGTSAA
jgi:glutamine synthetase